MASTYKTRQGEMIDMICRRTYGDESTYVEAVLEANPGLADLPSPLPMGTTITLPDLTTQTTSRTVVSLWD
ncbi:tail protein X [Ancylobacter amanitiformis]|uniref:Phage tail protein X n=1 Tax=Ancylobacter amanitiformis TaxID=217069 RepID=A0ABU0LQB6_9HYPH|nr:tail protein X [Ancylobacter amanitiformis]MDQ0510871.1 phage tail protein X [Ancylobacter amanitiformis]